MPGGRVPLARRQARPQPSTTAEHPRDSATQNRNSRFDTMNRHDAKPESGLASWRLCWPGSASRGRRAPLTIPACLRLNGFFRKSSTARAGKKNSLRSNSFFPDRPICTVFPGRSESAQIVVPASGPRYFLNAFRAKQCKSQAFSLCRRAACAPS